MANAIRIYKTGGPEVMVWEDHDPGNPGPGEALIRQEAVGLNFIDVYHRTGLYPLPSLPATPGMEGAGTVEAVGEGVTEVKVGDRVVFVLHVSLGPVGNNEIVDPLEGIAKDFRTVSQDLEVIFERPFPMKVLVGTVLGVSIDDGSAFLLSEHGFTSGSEAPTD